MSIENTLSRFRLISGMSGDEVNIWSELIYDSRDYILSLTVKEDIKKSDEKRLDNAAAVYAYYKYLSYSVSDESEFSAGDLKVSFNENKLKAAKEMWENELESIRDIVCNDKSLFIFKRVR